MPTKEEEQQQFLTFFLAGEEYATGILRVREIIEYDVITKIPKTPEWIRGVINLRGSVVPVVDLAVRFGMGERPVSSTTCIVVIDADMAGERSTMGIIADAVSQVIDLTPEDIEPPPSFGTQVRTDYLLGMAKLGKKFALILDLDRILSPQELLTVAEAQIQALETPEASVAPEPATEPQPETGEQPSA